MSMQDVLWHDIKDLDDVVQIHWFHETQKGVLVRIAENLALDTHIMDEVKEFARFIPGHDFYPRRMIDFPSLSPAWAARTTATEQ